VGCLELDSEAKAGSSCLQSVCACFRARGGNRAEPPAAVVFLLLLYSYWEKDGFNYDDYLEDFLDDELFPDGLPNGAGTRFSKAGLLCAIAAVVLAIAGSSMSL